MDMQQQTKPQYFHSKIQNNGQNLHLLKSWCQLWEELPKKDKRIKVITQPEPKSDYPSFLLSKLLYIVEVIAKHATCYSKWHY